MKTIAVIDDDIHIGNVLEELLQREGYAVIRAYSGTEAVLLLERSRPDLVLLDLMLPGLSGEEVLAKIEGIPVMVVSAKVGVEDKVSLLLGGAADYITKPLTAGSCWPALLSACGRAPPPDWLPCWRRAFCGWTPPPTPSPRRGPPFISPRRSTPF